jgi:3-deoxy-manno-octulosonate cytidylyltransferase (CMP-KDO synthetase)
MTSGVSVGTACVEEGNPRDASVVNVVGAFFAVGLMRCLYFTRSTVPYGPGSFWRHLGIYAWRRESLDRYVNLKRSPLEIRENLEQLRALEAGMRIDAAVVDDACPSIDMPADLDHVRSVVGAA